MAKWAWVLIMAGVGTPAVALAQGAVGEPVRVFLDCQTGGCDFNHFRREIGFVSWMRDRRDAEVHVLITGQGTGGGGRAYTLTFIGLQRFAGREDTLTHVTAATDTDTEVRDGLTRVLALGLVEFAVHTDAAARLRVAYTAPAGAEVEPHDPWDYWVFRVRVGGFIEGESQQNSQNVDGGLAATRVTDALKLRFGLDGEYGRNEFQVDSVTTVISTTHNWEADGLGAWTLGRHWSAGARGEVGASTFFNQDLYVRGGPVVEYDLFPYSESTRRLLTVQLTVGGIYQDYTETTIFGRDREGHPAHSLEMTFRQSEPWGAVETSLEWLQYWHDWGKHLVELFGELEIRLFRGLSLDLFGAFARVKDQIYLSQEGLTPDEVLLRRRQLGTDYRYVLNFGLSYRFGSIYNNIVNPRID